MQQWLNFLIRPRQKMADALYLFAALIFGGGFGGVLWQKISPGIGLPFAIFTTVVLHLMWRSPRVDR